MGVYYYYTLPAIWENAMHLLKVQLCFLWYGCLVSFHFFLLLLSVPFWGGQKVDFFLSNLDMICQKKSLTLKLYFFYSIGLVKLEKGAKTMITSAAWPRITVSSLWNLTTFNYLVVWPTKCLKNNVMINDTKTFFKNKHLVKPSFSLRKKKLL